MPFFRHLLRGLNILCRFLCVFLCLFSLTVLGHGGGLNKEGCHNNRGTGNYHCHQGHLAGKAYTSEATQRHAHERNTSLKNAPIYVRDDYLSRWQDADGDCQDTRNEVLIAESQEAVVMDAKGCRVLSGRWYDPYTGKFFTNPRDLDIDHLVPLAEAHRSGSSSWPQEKKHAFANDLDIPDALIAVDASVNRSKGNRDPANWMPPNSDFHCEYVTAWVNVKTAYSLHMDAEESLAIEKVIATCVSYTTPSLVP